MTDIAYYVYSRIDNEVNEELYNKHIIYMTLCHYDYWLYMCRGEYGYRKLGTSEQRTYILNNNNIPIRIYSMRPYCWWP